MSSQLSSCERREIPEWVETGFLSAIGAKKAAVKRASARACAELAQWQPRRGWHRSKARGLGLGRALIAAIIEEAVRIGYNEMRLDTLPTMAAAISI
jgi:GNAT superfamily N-acetyltransferase